MLNYCYVFSTTEKLKGLGSGANSLSGLNNRSPFYLHSCSHIKRSRLFKNFSDRQPTMGLLR